jgi:hypothetical protein
MTSSHAPKPQRIYPKWIAREMRKRSKRRKKTKVPMMSRKPRLTAQSEATILSTNTN